jgi:alpha-1,3-mannosyltransferase
MRHAAYVQSGFKPPFVPTPTPLEGLVPPFYTNDGAPRSLSNLPMELDDRFHNLLALAPSTLTCSWSESADRKYRSLQGQGPYLLALNLYDNEEVLPSLASTILRVADYLGPANTYVSIFENGSTDRTPLGLAHLAAALTALGTGHTITSDPTPTSWSNADRIAQVSLVLRRRCTLSDLLALPVRMQLAVYRNIALAPVKRPSTNQQSFKDIVFINDVYVCPQDTFELLYQRQLQNAHAVCAVDWRATKPWPAALWPTSVKMYDNWVRRFQAYNGLVIFMALHSLGVDAGGDAGC